MQKCYVSTSVKILYQIAIIFSVCLAGELLSAALPFPLPASIISMLIMLVMLFSGILKIDHIREKSDFLLSNMAFFFIPAGVGVIEHMGTISAFWLEFIVIVVVSTIVVFLVTAATATLFLLLENRRRGK